MGCGAGGEARCEGREGGSGWVGQGCEQCTEPAQKGSDGPWEPLRSHRLIESQNDLGCKGPLKII